MQLREVGSPDDEKLVQATVEVARPFEKAADLGPLVEELAQARVVMLGEASHGTHEFYEWRRIISQQLILHHGFRFIAVERDWPCHLDALVQYQCPVGQKSWVLWA